jgi:hypothetical protein
MKRKYNVLSSQNNRAWKISLLDPTELPAPYFPSSLSPRIHYATPNALERIREVSALKMFAKDSVGVHYAKDRVMGDTVHNIIFLASCCTVLFNKF